MRSHRIRLLSAVLASVAPGMAQDLYDDSVLRTLKLTFAQPDYWQQLTANRAPGTNIAASLEVAGVVYPGVGVRFKGNAAYEAIGSSEKKPFKIDLDWTDPDQDLWGVTSINLGNGFRDPTFCREVVTYEVLRRYMPAPRANFVRLEINGQDWGVYVNVEQVDKRFMERWFDDADGNRYKGDAQPSAPVGGTALTWLGLAFAPYQQSYELKTPGNPNVWVDLIAVCNRLNNTPSSQFPSQLDPLFEIDRALWYLAGCNVFAALDTYIGAGHNFYLLVDDAHQRMSITPWDLGESFGAFDNGLTTQQIKLIEPDYNRSHPYRPLLGKLLGEPIYRNRYYAHLRTLLEEAWSWDRLQPVLDRHRNLIRAAVAVDPKKLYTLAMFDQNFTDDTALPGSGRAGGIVPGLRSIVDTRRDYLVRHAALNQPVAGLESLTRTPARVSSRDSATVTVRAKFASVVTLYYRTQGAFRSVSMLDDGLHGDGAAGDGVFGGSIPPQAVGTRVRFYVEAEASGGGLVFLPRGAEHGAEGYTVESALGTSVLINEFMADNATTLRDEAGQYDDWIELVNPTPASIDVGGMYLSDDRTNRTKWRIPANTPILPGGTLLVWADDDATQGALHATFRLSATGEDVVLTDRDGVTVLDTVTFGAQTRDVSQARTPSAGATWTLHLTASPNASNDAPRCAARGYTALQPALLPGTIQLSGAMRTATTPAFPLRNLGASRPFAVLLATSPAHLALGFDPSVSLLLPPLHPIATGVTLGDGSATPSLPVPNDPAIDGLLVYLQAWSVGGGVLTGSHALTATVCR